MDVVFAACFSRRRRDVHKTKVRVWPRHGATAASGCTLFVPLWVFCTGQMRASCKDGKGGGGQKLDGIKAMERRQKNSPLEALCPQWSRVAGCVVVVVSLFFYFLVCCVFCSFWQNTTHRSFFVFGVYTVLSCTIQHVSFALLLQQYVLASLDLLVLGPMRVYRVPWRRPRVCTICYMCCVRFVAPCFFFFFSNAVGTFLG